MVDFQQWIGPAALAVAIYGAFQQRRQTRMMAVQLAERSTAIPRPWWRSPTIAALVVLVVAAWAPSFLPPEMIGRAQYPQKWPDQYRPISVIGKTFTNEVVLLDGYDYTDCTFTNVTLEYNGTTPIHLYDSHFRGLNWFQSKNAGMESFWNLMYGMGLLNKDTPFQRPPGTTVKPPRVLSPGDASPR